MLALNEQILSSLDSLVYEMDLFNWLHYALVDSEGDLKGNDQIDGIIMTSTSRDSTPTLLLK